MLFEPFMLSGLRLANRIVRSATFEKLADADGFVTEPLTGLDESLARGGCGLIITGCALVHTSGRHLPRMISAHSDIYLDGLRSLAGSVHEAGGLVALQLAHGGRHCPPLLIGGDALAPSPVYNPSTRTTPRAMTDPEIWEAVDAFSEAAWRAWSAGFDAVQVHAAHGCLLSSFLSPLTNRREDYWGGDEERRFHFIEEVLKAVREAVGKDYPVLVKLNADDCVKGGITPEESVRVAVRLQNMELDAVEISGGFRETRAGIAKTYSKGDEAYFRSAGKLFKSRLIIPVILTGGMRSRAVMEDVLAGGEADLIGLSRPLIREPDLPNLLEKGKEGADCVSCDKCTRFDKHKHVRCRQIGEGAGQG
jgi:2,4-dienoyl-CoA reductase-like NADH-dependent reductase (Old Yellow Enzyme family)